MDHRRLEPLTRPRDPLRATPESRAWSRFRPGPSHSHHSSVTRVHFASKYGNPSLASGISPPGENSPAGGGAGPPSPTDTLLVSTSGARCSLFSGASPLAQAPRSLTRFKDVAYGASLRSDGRLAAVGGEEGVVRVFDTRTRAVVREMGGARSGKKGAQAGARTVVAGAAGASASGNGGRGDARGLEGINEIDAGGSRWGGSGSRRGGGGGGGVPPVRVSGFTEDGVRVFSAADDGAVSLWDLSTGQLTVRFEGAHGDYVRDACTSAAAADLVATGSYDHRLRVWDLRSERCALECDHGAPIEAVAVSESGTMYFTAGQSTVKVWDALGGMRLVATLAGHQKTVTSLALAAGGTRLLTGSLDTQVKVYDLATMRCAHSMRFAEPITALAVDPSTSVLVAGHPSGLLSSRVRRGAQPLVWSSIGESDAAAAAAAAAAPSGSREDSAEVTPEQLLAIRAGRVGVDFEAERLAAAAPRPGSSRFFRRGKGARPAEDDHLVISGRRARLQPYDKLLKRFRYGAALDAALETNRPPVVCALLDELAQREALATALQGRDAASVAPLLKFLLRHVTNPKYASLLVQVAEQTLDIYAGEAGESPDVDELFLRLRNKVRAEVGFQNELQGMVGALDMLMAASVL